MNYPRIKQELKQLKTRLNKENHRQVKKELIDLQTQMSSLELVPMHRTELRDEMQKLFEVIKEVQQQDQEQFEQEAAYNYRFLKEKVKQAIELVEENPDDHERIWPQLVETQAYFKGRKMIAEQREQLFQTLQTLFELVKKRKEADRKEEEKISDQFFEKLDDEVEHMVSIAETHDLDQLWSVLLETKDKIQNSRLVYTHRKRLMDKLQEAFVVAKIRREEKHQDFLQQARHSARYIEERLDAAQSQLEENPVFKENWQLLLDIQQEFRQHKLEKETREILYQKLQHLFEKLKGHQSQQQSDFERQAQENTSYLAPLVSKAFEEAQNSMEFKKTKGFLIKVQSEFKGRKMRSEDREKLYSRLQTAFDTLQKRLDAYIASRKEVREFRVEGQMSDVEMKIDQLHRSLETDQEKLELLETSYADSLNLPTGKSDPENLASQIEIMKAAIARKEQELTILLQEKDKLLLRKERLDNLESND